jgi:hypothetical protein
MLLENAFPRLRQTGYTITSPATEDYNCVAWAAKENDRWWWPDPMGMGYWPQNAPREVTLDAFLTTFSIVGFEICSGDLLEPGFEKIAIYVDAHGEPTHVARQLGSGQWTSKLGKSVDIEHAFDSLDNSKLYGSIARILRRAT